MDNNKARIKRALDDLWPHDNWPPPDTLTWIDATTVALVAPWFSLIIELSKPVTQQQVLLAQTRMRAAGVLVNIRITNDG